MNITSSFIAEAVSSHTVGLHTTQLHTRIAQYSTVEQANAELYQLTGIHCFFPTCNAFEEFQHLLLDSPAPIARPADRQWGDFQTPPELARQVCQYLVASGVAPDIIIEPTHGTGNFLLAALQAFPNTKLVYGVEIQAKYVWQSKMALLIKGLLGQRSSAAIELYQDDIFTHTFPESILEAEHLLVIGNPPWITNAELGMLAGHNLPVKSNLKALNGIDAITGKSNFDISEFILLRLLELFSVRRGTLAMLCKNTVIKNLVALLPRRNVMVSNVRAFSIDARRTFDAAVEASLLVMDLGAAQPVYSCQLGHFQSPNHITGAFGWVDSQFVSDIESYTSYRQMDGSSPFVWRQGLKHDCAKVMELSYADGKWINGFGKLVDIEDEWIYWLVKSSDVRRFAISQARKGVIAPQHHPAEETLHLQHQAPGLWDYLLAHSTYLDSRKSSIYRNKPRFSMFGIGAYSFKPYKVVVSGLYKAPFFSLVSPIDNRLVMADDTCYTLGFDAYQEALFTVTLLNTQAVKCFLQSIAFVDAKRPYTKEVLMRINLAHVAAQFSFQRLCDQWTQHGYEPHMPIGAGDFAGYQQQLGSLSQPRSSVQLDFGI